MEPQFDRRGHLTPARNIPMGLADFRRLFVEEFMDETRSRLFSGFMAFVEGIFTSLPVESVFIWIDGSFATRKENPKDIDLVYFLDAALVEQNEAVLLSKFSQNESKNVYGVDAYLVRVFASDHPLYFYTASDKAYWTELFTKCRRNRKGICHQKGFVELQLQRNEFF
ncbi:MAG: hypothetical protein KF852_19715 [Saprospiraceae bacterium]|nr:hypothetical protein [Saprospiraceae bacterium]